MPKRKTLLQPSALAGNQRALAQEVIVPQLVPVPHLKAQGPKREQRAQEGSLHREEDSDGRSRKTYSYFVCQFDNH